MDELLKYRAEFPILERSTYMISNSLGAMPRGVYDSLHTYADMWATRGVRAWHEGWWELAVTAGDKIAALIGAAPGTISLHQNVTLTEATIASCFDFSGPRNKVVMVSGEFPSVQYFYLAQRKYGAKVQIVDGGDSLRPPLEQFLEAIDETTLLVPISMVLFRSAHIVDVRAIVEKAHRVGAHVILDCFQATGTIPVDVRALEVDFCVGGVLKWLCGGPGVAFYLYVRPDLQRNSILRLQVGSRTSAHVEFEIGANVPREDAFRFLNGTTHIPALYACQPGLDIINKVGIAKIREKSMRQTKLLMEGAAKRGWKINTPVDAAVRAGTVSIDCPHSREVTAELLKRDILVDFRPSAGVRLSPHFYTTDAELDFALAQMEEIVAAHTGAA